MHRGFRSWLVAMLIFAGACWAGAVWDARAMAQQKENASDSEIAENIRRAVGQENGLSRAAQNVQIVVRDGEAIQGSHGQRPARSRYRGAR